MGLQKYDKLVILSPFLFPSEKKVERKRGERSSKPIFQPDFYRPKLIHHLDYTLHMVIISPFLFPRKRREEEKEKSCKTGFELAFCSPINAYQKFEVII